MAVAIIVPVVTFALQADQDLDNLSRQINDPSQGTAPNMTFVDPAEVAENHANTILFVVVIEVVFLILFVAALYLGINHYHGQLDKPKNPVD